MNTDSYKKILLTRGFLPYLWAEFLGVFNDNVLKMVLTLIAVSAAKSHINPQAVSSLEVSLIGAVFILPFILFSGYGGYLADAYSKRSVLIVVKTLEIVAMTLALIVLPLNIFSLNLTVLFLVSTQAAFFSPAKYGILPEVFDETKISRANGIVEMTTYVAIIMGVIVGSSVHEYFSDQKHLIGVILILIAIAGWASIWRIPKTKAPLTKEKFPLNPWHEIGQGIVRLRENKHLRLAVVGISWFWFFAALLQLTLIMMSKEILHLSDTQTGNLQASLAIGIGLGSILAGRLSSGHIELALVPLGAVGIGISTLFLAMNTLNVNYVLVSLFFMGLFGGLYIVPLNATLQQIAQRKEKGRLIATSNVFSMTGVFIASGVLYLFHDVFNIASNNIILIFGIMTIVVTILAATVLPEILVRSVLWVFTYTFYRIKKIGIEHIPKTGPAMLVSNHMSFSDAMLISACTNRNIHFMIDTGIYNVKILKPFLKVMGVIPVYRGKRINETFERARQVLQKGELVCIFAEGGLSRIGNILPFKRGYEKVIQNMDVPIIPVNLDSVWGTLFSFNRQREFIKFPRRILYRVTVSFGKKMPSTALPLYVGQAVRELGAHAFSKRKTVRDTLPRRFIKDVKSNFWRLAMADSSGIELRYFQVLIAAGALSNHILRHSGLQKMIGIMLPSSVGGAIANIAVNLAGKTSVNINFTAGKEVFDYIVDECELKTIITSRKFIDKLSLPPDSSMIYLEDLLAEISLSEKLLIFAKYMLLPTSLSWTWNGGKNVTPKSTATVIFSSGSTGRVKGIRLSHSNILANIEGLSQSYPHNKSDKFTGILPFFHAFGYTATIWFPLTQGMASVFHYSPLEAKIIGKLVRKYKPSFLISSSIFYHHYIKSLRREDFAPVKFAIAGAEKLLPQIAQDYKAKFGKEIFEGYGCSETSPVISVNAPDFLVVSDKWLQKAKKAGSVGLPLPGLVVKTVDPETGNDLPLGEKGMLMVKGASVMEGYLHDHEKTHNAIIDGWYKTGDIAQVDQDGFITIIDRYSRFSKIAGEMVPHLRIEQEINNILGDISSFVTAVVNQKKGESLVVLFSHKSITPQKLWDKLNASELSKLWIPKENRIFKVGELPMLTSGKIDMQKAKAKINEKLLSI